MNHPGLNQFADREYINLGTIKRSGQVILTPVWFIEDRGLLYIRTLATSGKIKRIRNNSTIRVTPCEANGDPIGHWSPAEAHEVDLAEFERIDQLFRQKYGWRKNLFDFLVRLQRKSWMFLTIRFQNET